jgi:hypothetical protein
MERIRVKVGKKGLFLLLAHRFNSRAQIVKVLSGALYSLKGTGERMGVLVSHRCS